MPNSAEDDALTQALIAQLMAEDLGETLHQHRRLIGSSVEDYEKPVFDRGDLDDTAGEDGTGWGNEDTEGAGSGTVEAASDEPETQPSDEYPGGWDSQIAYTDGLQPASTGIQKDKEQDNNQYNGHTANFTNKSSVSGPLPAYTAKDPFTMSLANRPANDGPRNVWLETSTSPTAKELAAANVSPPATTSSTDPNESEHRLINVWGPEDMDMDIDTSSEKNKGKARAVDTDEDADDDADEVDGNEAYGIDEDTDDQPTPKAKGKGRESDITWDTLLDPAQSSLDPLNPTARESKYSALMAKYSRHLNKGSALGTRLLPLGPITTPPLSLLTTCTCRSCENYPGFKDDEGNEIPLIHIPWPGSERNEILERAEDNEVVDIHLGEDETLDSILADMSLRDERGVSAC